MKHPSLPEILYPAGLMQKKGIDQVSWTGQFINGEML